MSPSPGILLLFIAAAAPQPAAQEPAPRPGLRTRWAAEVDRAAPHPEHPRPQLARADSDWLSLNGEWEFALTAASQDRPPLELPDRIVVPFPVESALSGIGRRVEMGQLAWYRRLLQLPDGWQGKRVILHFGAADWRTSVWLDRRLVGTHEGGYDPFSIDLGDLLADGHPHYLSVSAWDPTDRGPQPRGKQVLAPEGIWYTPTSGIWQSVWIEAVSDTYLASLRLRGSFLRGELELAASLAGEAAGCELDATISLAGAEVQRARGVFGASGRLALRIRIDEPRAWSPDSPTLYDLELRIVRGGEIADRATSYFGLRDIEVKPDSAGVPRILLNGEALFQLGTLDQGFWPDGLYTAPTDEALRSDLEVTKRLGFNLIRKHVKVEPDRWYAWCDRMGLLVWQDMPSGDRYIGPSDPDVERDARSRGIYYQELGELIEDFGNHPCIVAWVPFNEGWGQFETAAVVDWIRARDPGRLIDATSGWADRGAGDLHDVHVYPGPGMPPLEAGRAAVLGEFGGLGLPLPGHTWQEERNWGYRSFSDRDALTEAYLALVGELRLLVPQGLCAAVYTQTTDVEIEVNGLLSYDREILKMDEARVRAANLRLYEPPPVIETLLPNSRLAPQAWRYRGETPAAGWEQPEFDDSAWEEGPGGFGREGTPGAVIGTAWLGEELWLRREFDLPATLPAGELQLQIHHDEDAEVWLNGMRIAALAGYTTSYRLIALGPETRAALRPGARNVLALHCRQTTGGQFLDAGLVVVRER